MQGIPIFNYTCNPHPAASKKLKKSSTRRQQRASPSTHNTIRIHIHIPSTRRQQRASPSTHNTIHIQHHPHPHTSAQPHTSNTAAYIHKSTTLHHHNQELLKKARGVCRGAMALWPLCGFPLFPQNPKKCLFTHISLKSLQKN